MGIALGNLAREALAPTLFVARTDVDHRAGNGTRLRANDRLSPDTRGRRAGDARPTASSRLLGTEQFSRLLPGCHEHSTAP